MLRPTLLRAPHNHYGNLSFNLNVVLRLFWRSSAPRFPMRAAVPMVLFKHHSLCQSVNTRVTVSRSVRLHVPPDAVGPDGSAAPSTTDRAILGSGTHLNSHAGRTLWSASLFNWLFLEST